MPDYTSAAERPVLVAAGDGASAASLGRAGSQYDQHVAAAPGLRRDSIKRLSETEDVPGVR
jgi:hypothetical protein